MTLTILMLIGTIGASLAISQFVMAQPQGRYLFVVLPFVAYSIALFATGARRAEGGADLNGTKIGALAALAVFMLLLNLYSALFVVSPANLAWAGRNPLLSLSPERLSIELNGMLGSLTESDKGLVITIPRRISRDAGWVDTLSRDEHGMIELSGWAFELRARGAGCGRCSVQWRYRNPSRKCGSQSTGCRRGSQEP